MVGIETTLMLTAAVVKRRQKTILGPIDLHLANTGFTIVLGPNGAGKTTLLKVLHGIERLSGGQLHGATPAQLSRQQQAYVFQSPIMLRRSVWANLAYPLHLIGSPKIEISQKVDHWAERIGLATALDRPAPRLSAGEKQKLALARALIRAPKTVFLDEPCANLDGRSTREIENLLHEAFAAGTRIIMTTHDLGQARRLATDAVFMVKGQINDQGAAPGIFDNARTPESRAFFAGEIVE